MSFRHLRIPRQWNVGLSCNSTALNSWIWLWQQSFSLIDRWVSDTTPSKSAAWQFDLTALFKLNILLVPGTTSTWQDKSGKKKKIIIFFCRYPCIKIIEMNCPYAVVVSVQYPDYAFNLSLVPSDKTWACQAAGCMIILVTTMTKHLYKSLIVQTIPSIT